MGNSSSTDIGCPCAHGENAVHDDQDQEQKEVSLSNIAISVEEPPKKEGRVKKAPQRRMQRSVSSGFINGRVRRFKDFYELSEEVLGSGAFGTVKVCYPKGKEGEKLAAKEVLKSKLSERDTEALMEEVSITKSINHPHVVRLLDFFDDDELDDGRVGKRTGCYYLVLELVRGGELFDRIVQKQSYNEAEARDLVSLLLETMRYLHEDVKIVHRDLKPENLLLSSEDDDTTVKVADFGFARSITDLEAEGSEADICGTVSYISPEMVLGLIHPGPYVDIWALGCIVYILLGGYPPFYVDDEDTRPGTEDEKLFDIIRRGKYEFHEEYWGQISEDAKDLIRKMLEVDHEKRWTAAQLLEHPWIKQDKDVLSKLDITGTLNELRKFNARRKLKAGIGAVIAARRFSNAMDALKDAAADVAAGAGEAEVEG